VRATLDFLRAEFARDPLLQDEAAALRLSTAHVPSGENSQSSSLKGG